MIPSFACALCNCHHSTKFTETNKWRFPLFSFFH